MAEQQGEGAVAAIAVEKKGREKRRALIFWLVFHLDENDPNFTWLKFNLRKYLLLIKIRGNDGN